MSEESQAPEIQGGVPGGVSNEIDTSRHRVNSPVLTRSELRSLQRAAKRYPLTEADAELAVNCIRDAMSSDEDRTRVRAVEVQIAMRESDRAEEMHALEMEERLRALEKETPAVAQQSQQAGVIVTGPVQINQQIGGQDDMMLAAVAAAFGRSASRQVPVPAEAQSEQSP